LVSLGLLALLGTPDLSVLLAQSGPMGRPALRVLLVPRVLKDLRATRVLRVLRVRLVRRVRVGRSVPLARRDLKDRREPPAVLVLRVNRVLVV
jgi:hypothetical protein